MPDNPYKPYNARHRPLPMLKYPKDDPRHHIGTCFEVMRQDMLRPKRLRQQIQRAKDEGNTFTIPDDEMDLKMAHKLAHDAAKFMITVCAKGSLNRKDFDKMVAKHEMVQALYKMPPEQFEEALNDAIQDGTLDDGAADMIREGYKKERTADALQKARDAKKLPGRSMDPNRNKKCPDTPETACEETSTTQTTSTNEYGEFDSDPDPTKPESS